MKGDTALAEGIFIHFTFKNPQSLRTSSFQKGAQNIYSQITKHEKIHKNYNLNNHIYSTFNHLFPRF
jgi:hypothetical protein